MIETLTSHLKDTNEGVPQLGVVNPPSARQNIGATVVLLAASCALSLIVQKYRRGQTQAADDAVRDVVQPARNPALDLAARPVTVLSIPIVLVSATAALVWWLHREGRTEAAYAVAFAPVAAASLGQGFTSFLQQQRNPPDKADAPTGETVEASFPSGHTAGVTAEALSIAYILQNEGLSSAPVLAALIGWPLLVGVTRVYRDRHWASDVLAGWIAGTAVAAAAALLYAGLRTHAAGPAPASEGEGNNRMVALQPQASQ